MNMYQVHKLDRPSQTTIQYKYNVYVLNKIQGLRTVIGKGQ